MTDSETLSSSTTISTTTSNPNKTMKSRILLLIILILTIASCRQSGVPSQYTDSKELPPIYPDYTGGIVVPINIAPLTFQLTVQAEDMVTRLSSGQEEIVIGGLQAKPDIDSWHEMAKKASGNMIKVEVFAKRNDQWQRYKPFDIQISHDSIDPYISYRLIPPSYVSYEEITINQRCLENYDEQTIYNNLLCSSPSQGQCINCHHYQQYNPERMQFHARQRYGGTFISIDGKSKKVNMASDSVLSAGVYPAWHPQLPLIAYSTNKTLQSFHTQDINKIEVLDAASDLILYDINSGKIKHIERDPQEFETFPCWTPDGRTLYYVSAHFEYPGDTINIAHTITHAKDIKYAIYRKSFNPETLSFGERELVYDAPSIGQSATLPRISPDGRWLMFTRGEWGCFHIWHRDADLWLMNLQTMETRPLNECNSDNVESYHSWSSNGRWIIFSSRRNDGVYTRPFIAHIDSDGHVSPPFELPSASPSHHLELMKSYNIPEFMKGPFKLSPHEIADVLKRN